MNSSPITTAAPDESRRAGELIALGLALDPESRSETLARIIAASVHSGPGSAVERFAATGIVDQQGMLEELNHVQVPIEQEAWIDALGRFVLLRRDGRS